MEILVMSNVGILNLRSDGVGIGRFHALERVIIFNDS